MKPDVVSVLERIYDVDRSPEAWLAAVAEAADPLLDQGSGTYGYFVDLSRASRVEASGFVAAPGSDMAQLATFGQWAAATPLWFQRAIHLSLPCGFGAELPREPYLSAVENSMQSVGKVDVFGVNGIDATKRGAVLAAFAADSSRRGARPDHAIWARVASHLATGARLVQELAAVGAREAPEAVLSPDGGLEHADAAAKEPEARDALREMVRRIDRARTGAVRQSADEASLLWEAMVLGRWSLLDHFDTDGRRYVVARVNEPVTHPLADLSERERQVTGLAANGRSNKLIAYELGVAESTVSTLLSRAQRKLGAADRVDLIRVYLQHCWRLGP
ncbi:MAG: helix-turn-helix transcriptional regulator [Polyangiaceae bacterium]|nr:helix-turn-helix transcriptional regulator [Polyangiaceae bacterium]